MSRVSMTPLLKELKCDDIPRCCMKRSTLPKSDME